MSKAQPQDQQSTTRAQRGASDDIARHDWSVAEVADFYELPFNDLLYRAQQVHREHFDANEIQLSTLLSIKTGGCPEDCGYCNQSAHHDTGLKAEKLMDPQQVIAEARAAKASGSSRYCMGAAWRNPKQRDMAKIVEMIKGVRALGLETCMTLGMLSDEQAAQLADAGLDYYNHNVDTSREFYGKVITTRSYDDRLDTLARVQDAGINVCSGGIVGMGESRRDRAAMLVTLANLPEHPQSVPINLLVQTEGTPMFGNDRLDPLEFVRTIAVARILMPTSMVRLSAGREEMPESIQALCFLAGANSMFVGPKLLTTPNPSRDRDLTMMNKLGLRPMPLGGAEQQNGLSVEVLEVAEKGAGCGGKCACH